MRTKTRAIVAVAPSLPDHKEGANWELNDVLVPTVEDLKDGEVLVQIVATGICHTDLSITSAPVFPYPRVAGHEGSGYVKAVGPRGSKDLQVGDPVLLSYSTCTKCRPCSSGRPAGCEKWTAINVLGESDGFKSLDGTQNISGSFFGQSSFANLTVAKESSVVCVKGLIKNDEELKLFAPMGCGYMTGAGTILNVARPSRKDKVLVLGLGGVGMSAIMAAALTDCQTIIAVDREASRLQIAKDVGATLTVDTTGVADMQTVFTQITGGDGPTIVIDTTGVGDLIDSAYDSLQYRGTLIHVGITDQHYRIKVTPNELLAMPKWITGTLLGDAVPSELIPELITYYREGKFPIDKLARYYKADDFKAAVHDIHSGETIKAVLV